MGMIVTEVADWTMSDTGDLVVQIIARDSHKLGKRDCIPSIAVLI